MPSPRALYGTGRELDTLRQRTVQINYACYHVYVPTGAVNPLAKHNMAEQNPAYMFALVKTATLSHHLVRSFFI